jgi:hypothetical protein
MLNRKWVMGAIVASALGAIPVVASAAIYVDIAPPDPRPEVVPAPRAGFVWAPGFYAYRNNHYVWTAGHWEREHHGQYWHPGHWVEHEGRWTFNEPGWHNERFAYNGRGYARHDRDGDGVPDNLDRAPDNPHRQ